MYKSIHVIFLLLIITILNSCGTKGPLYIPEKEYPQDKSSTK